MFSLYYYQLALVTPGNLHSEANFLNHILDRLNFLYTPLPLPLSKHLFLILVFELFLGNFSLGIKEQIVFPEVDYNKIDKIRGMNIIIVTSTNNNEEAKFLLKTFNLPFYN